MPLRPYRTHWRTADPNQLQAMSVADRRPDDPYRPYEEEQALIAEWLSKDFKPPASLFYRWAFHPDERVRAELIRSGKMYYWMGTAFYPGNHPAQADWTETFLDRMLADMQAEGVYWTPLFDEFACADYRIREHIVPAVNALAPWLQTRATSDDVREMLQTYRSYGIVEAILTHAGCIDRKLAREIYEHIKDPYQIVALAGNAAISTDVMAALVEWVAEDWETRIRGGSAVRNDSHVCLSELLRKHPSVVSHEVLRRVYALPKLAHDLGVRAIELGEYLDMQRDRSGTAPEVALFEVTLLSTKIAYFRLPAPPDVLCAVIPFLRQKGDLLCELLFEHPNTDVTVWREALNHTRIWKIHERAARTPELYQDPEVRERLLKSRNRKVPLILAQNADPQTAAEAVRYLIARGQLKRAAEALAARAPEKPIALEPADLKPLLQSNDQSIRLAGIAGLSRLRAQAQPTTNPKPLRSATAQRKNL